MVETPKYPAAASLPEAIDPRAILKVCLCHNLRRAARVITRRFDAALQAVGLNAGQFAILTAVAADPGLSMGTLRRHLDLERSTLTRVIKPMQDRGFVVIAAAAGRRGGTIDLTTEGDAVLREACKLWQATQSEIAGRLGAGKAGQLLSVLAATARAGSE